MRKKNIFIGLLFIFAGIGLLLNKLGYFREIRLLSVLLSVILLINAIKNLSRRNFGGVLFPLAFIGILFSKELGIEAITPWTILGVAALGSIGLSIIFKPKYCNISRYSFSDENMSKMKINDDGSAYISSVFSSGIKYLKQDNFKNAIVTSKFGDLKVYFDGSKIKDKAVLNIDVKFGSLSLFIPKEWKVVNNVNILFADIRTSGENLGTSDELLILSGDVKFGDIRIIYV